MAYVFCYRTQEGKDILMKWLRSKLESLPRFSKMLCCFNRGSNEFGLISTNNKSSLSTRSNNSACNGHEAITELVNLSDNPNVSQF